MVLVLLVPIIDVVIDSVLVEPSVDGLRLDTTDRQKSSARSGRDAHGKHTLEQGLTLTTAKNRMALKSSQDFTKSSPRDTG